MSTQELAARKALGGFRYNLRLRAAGIRDKAIVCNQGPQAFKSPKDSIHRLRQVNYVGAVRGIA